MTRRGSHINPLPLLLGILACVPLLRYLVLSNHSYIHCFFTYRALFATIFCIGTAVCQGVDADWLKRNGGSYGTHPNPEQPGSAGADDSHALSE